MALAATSATTGASLTPATVTVTTPVLDTAPLLSVAVYSNVTSRVSPTARSWKSAPGSKVKVPSPLSATAPSPGNAVMA